jgi:hypothetical protein
MMFASFLRTVLPATFKNDGKIQGATIVEMIVTLRFEVTDDVLTTGLKIITNDLDLCALYKYVCADAPFSQSHWFMKRSVGEQQVRSMTYNFVS